MVINRFDYRFIVKLLFPLLLLTPFIVSCTEEAPQVAEFDFEESCGSCHSSSNPEYALLGTRESYMHSGHFLGYEKHVKNASYANGGGCQQCHTNEGFIEYVTTGQVDSEGYIANPSQPGCFTCHDPHATGDFSVRTVPELKLAGGEVINLKGGNLCGTCHRARRDATALVKATPADKLPSYWGPHHGPEADIMAGSSAFEFPGKSYSSSLHMNAIADTCVTCHMALPEGRYSLSSEVGGHSFFVVGDVHGSDKVNLAACTSCHGDLKQLSGTPYFDYKTEDYDRDGEVEAVQLEILGLLEILVNDRGSGLLQKLDPPIYKADGSYNWIRGNSQERPVEQVAALYNYKLVLEDRSLGIHNVKYVVQVLYDTIESLDDDFDTALRP